MTPLPIGTAASGAAQLPSPGVELLARAGHIAAIGSRRLSTLAVSMLGGVSCDPADDVDVRNDPCADSMQHESTSTSRTSVLHLDCLPVCAGAACRAGVEDIAELPLPCSRLAASFWSAALSSFWVSCQARWSKASPHPATPRHRRWRTPKQPSTALRWK